MSTSPVRAPVERDGTGIVAVAAAAWGLDGLFRKPLATELPAATVVVWEHLVGVLACMRLVPSALRAFARCSRLERLAVLAIGAGASALATALFTRSFALAASTGDFVTPLVLQKLQPLVAIILAAILLGERARPAYACYAAPALGGAWLLTFADPVHVHVAAAESAALALGAAALWAAGTVLGRYVSRSVAPRELTALRYLVGLPTALVIALLTGANLAPGWHNLLGLVLLGLIPGVLALLLYYVGLRRSPATRATLAELAFPATSAVVGVWVLGSHLDASQWIGFAVLVAAVAGLGVHERTSNHPVVAVSAPRRTAPAAV